MYTLEGRRGAGWQDVACSRRVCVCVCVEVKVSAALLYLFFLRGEPTQWVAADVAAGARSVGVSVFHSAALQGN